MGTEVHHGYGVNHGYGVHHGYGVQHGYGFHHGYMVHHGYGVHHGYWVQAQRNQSEAKDFFETKMTKEMMMKEMMMMVVKIVNCRPAALPPVKMNQNSARMLNMPSLFLLLLQRHIWTQ